MKKTISTLANLLIITLANLLIITSIFAQSPEKMSYQAVVRDGSNNLVTSASVGMQISILQGSASGTAVYVETQTPTSNANGLVSVEIGNGTVVSGDFTTIDWANGPYFVKSETDPTGGTSYSITGTSQLLSVPYALHAKTAETVTGTITETDPIYGSSVASGITGTDTTNWNNKLDSYTETDPVFGSSVAGGITGADTTNWNNKLDSYTETDPIYGSSVASGITGTDTTNWNNKLDSYTETDPVFGSSIAGGITGTDTTNWNNKLDSYTETDPVFGSSVAGGITGTDTTNWNNKQDQLISGTNISIVGDTISATGGSTLAIGDNYQGGVIFWLDASGQHGLIAATADQSTGIGWYNSTYRYTGTTGDGLYAGAMNTAMIVATQMADNQTGNFAAKVCADYSVTVSGVTYGDWYLPSKYELNILYLQKNAVGGFASAYYWSSTENSNGLGAWVQDFGSGNQDDFDKSFTFRVRAVRAF